MADKQPAGLSLDPGDATDRQIIARQAKAARASGREGRDRARTTRGRADLEAAYDEGAAEQAGPDSEDQADAEPAGPSRADRVKAGAKKAGKASSSYLSRGRWAPTLTPPTRARDTGSLLTGMLLYIGLITYIRYGPAGWKGWLAAKFLNRPMQGTPALSDPQQIPRRRGAAT